MSNHPEIYLILFLFSVALSFVLIIVKKSQDKEKLKQQKMSSELLQNNNQKSPEDSEPEKNSFIRNSYYRIKNSFAMGFWTFRNPTILNISTFELLAQLHKLIMEVAIEGKPRMSNLAYIHPEEGEKEIVSLWAGAGIGADPIKRCGELARENMLLKEELGKKISKPSTYSENINKIIEKHKRKLNVLKDNLANWEEYKWTDTEIKECQAMIQTLALILSDLNNAKNE
jgi:hypothetical protein